MKKLQHKAKFACQLLGSFPSSYKLKAFGEEVGVQGDNNSIGSIPVRQHPESDIVRSKCLRALCRDGRDSRFTVACPIR